MAKQGTYEFVVRDSSKIQGLHTELRAVSDVLQCLDRASEQLSYDDESRVYEAVNCVADILQRVVLESTGVDIRRADTLESSSSVPLESSLRVLNGLCGEKSKVIGHPPHRQLQGHLNSVKIGLGAYRNELTSNGLTRHSDQLLTSISKTLEALSSQIVEPVEARSRGTRPQIILVEDDVLERELLSKLLAKKGFDVIDFGDGIEAIDYIFKERPDATVLLDMRLPKCDGPETIRRIRSNNHVRHLPIIGMSGVEPVGDIDFGEGGVSAWFNKPVNPEHLCDLLSGGNGQPETDWSTPHQRSSALAN